MNADQRRSGLDRDPVSHTVLGVFFDVYNELGFGFLEAVYRRALALELRSRGLSALEEVPLPVYVRRHVVGDYRADLMVERQLIAEVKVADAIHPRHRAQLLNYLRASDVERGLILNFGPKAQFERLVFSNDRKRRVP